MGRHGDDDPKKPPPLQPDEAKDVLSWARQAALSRGANAHEADEVAQITLEKLWLRWDSAGVAAARTAGPERWSAYVRTVAFNAHKDQIRGYQRWMDRARQDLPAVDPDRVGRPNVIRRPLIAGVAGSHIARLLLVEQLAQLPDRQRRIAFLRIEVGMSNREVARELEIQPQTVRKHFRLALDVLREQLQADLSDLSGDLGEGMTGT